MAGGYGSYHGYGRSERVWYTVSTVSMMCIIDMMGVVMGQVRTKTYFEQGHFHLGITVKPPK